mmetsp:Transcript_49335/g.159286  ORF Transcript_49335/g.159286 Transcript_49335/m.159286 type:complete len:291 (-) Transcript_49335:511-1383(-)
MRRPVHPKWPPKTPTHPTHARGCMRQCRSVRRHLARLGVAKLSVAAEPHWRPPRCASLASPARQPRLGHVVEVVDVAASCLGEDQPQVHEAFDSAVRPDDRTAADPAVAAHLEGQLDLPDVRLGKQIRLVHGENREAIGLHPGQASGSVDVDVGAVRLPRSPPRRAPDVGGQACDLTHAEERGRGPAQAHREHLRFPIFAIAVAVWQIFQRQHIDLQRAGPQSCEALLLRGSTANPGAAAYPAAGHFNEQLADELRVVDLATTIRVHLPKERPQVLFVDAELVDACPHLL